MQYLPYDGYSYYIDSLNFYHFNVVVPYSPYNYRVEVVSPVLPVVSGESETTIPSVTITDFVTWVQSAEFLVRDENDVLFHITRLLIDIAREVIDYDLCGSVTMFRRAVSYYVGHYLELHIKALKDEQSKMSLNQELVREENPEDKKLELIDSHYGDFKKTIWGQMFWAIYGHNAKFRIGYIPY